MSDRIIRLKLDEIKPYKKNPRINEHAVKAVANSIKEFGFRVPILVDKNNVIIAGHTRLKAAKYLGMEEVPCVRIEDLTDEQIRAFRIADNSTASMSEWDIDLLKLELEDLKPYDMTDFGLYIDEDGIVQEKGKNEKEIPKMELRAFEHYDYLVFVFDNQHDYIRMAQEFGIKRVDAGWSNRKMGIGRVIKGAELVKRIEDKNNNNK